MFVNGEGAAKPSWKSGVNWAILSVSRPKLFILPAVDEYVDGGVEDEEEVGEEGEDLAPHRPVVQPLRAVDQEQANLQQSAQY